MACLYSFEKLLVEIFYTQIYLYTVFSGMYD